MRITDAALNDSLVEHLFRYLAVPSQSDARAKVVPSTAGQRATNRLLKVELDGLGASEVYVDAQAVLTAKLLRVAKHPEILPYAGQDVIVTDGTSVVGADTRGAVAILITLATELNHSKVP